MKMSKSGKMTFARMVQGVWVGKDRVGEGGQGGSTKLSGTFKGDMHEVPGYPLHEERGRLGVEARSRPWSVPRGVRVRKGVVRVRKCKGRGGSGGWSGWVNQIEWDLQGGYA
jgi:hypothetical protein